MFRLIVLTLSIFKIVGCFYLEAESNYLKPKLERNNIVNKGIWVRNKLQEDVFEKNNLGNFIFRPNSVDAEHVMQNNFDAFADNTMQDSQFVSNYVQRTRRSPDQIRKRRPRKSTKSREGKFVKTSIEDSAMIKSKIVTDLKPTSVFNEYPYEIATLLNNNSIKTNNTHKRDNKKELNDSKNENLTKNIAHAEKTKQVDVVPLNHNSTQDDVISKRSRKYNVKYDRIDNEVYNYNMVDENNTEIISKQDRAVSNEGKLVNWNVGPNVPNSNIYKAPKEPIQPKSVTERGLIKIISMLTRTFKKIMKQHNDIKDIHDRLISINQNFDHKVAELNSKFEDFDSKYSDMIQFNDKIKAFENQLETQRDYFDIKQRELKNSINEFQSQQKNFLAQQKQFYNIQKLMLAQNEKINAKQSLIAKTQSQISLRQNNFARILKKAKQIVNESKSMTPNVAFNYNSPTNTIQTTEPRKYNLKTEKTSSTTTAIPPSTQAMKINLFTIPTKNKLIDQDALIIKEKDDKQIDDLVYKYYFNNTFIDTLMKSKILNNYASNINSVEIVNRSKQSKNKRDGLETTLMLPINNNLLPSKRERRWINHFSKNKYRRSNRHRKTTTVPKFTTSNNLLNNDVTNAKGQEDLTVNEIKHVDDAKKDPFSTMATNFCHEIGQNTNYQVLKWCVEKALRRLKFMERNSFTPPSVTVMVEKNQREKETDRVTDEMSTPTVNVPLSRTEPATVLKPTAAKVTPMFAMSTVPGQDEKEIFFPDNDKLESNLKQYDLTPDTEGNVYYEGSVHISDFGRMVTESDAMSDILPGLIESDSKFDIDPLTFDLQAKRRAYVRRLNENILKQMKGR